jgi:hypothetical protein
MNLIVKERITPKILLIDEALKRRLPQNHPKLTTINEDLLRRRAGHRGEKAIDYYLKFIPDNQYSIFHGLRLPYKDVHFQIDTLLLSTQLAIILEVKNFSGELLFDTTKEQFTRTLNGNVTGYSDPISQAKRHKHQLLAFFERHSIPAIPIEFLIVISFPTTTFSTIPANASILRKICHAHSLKERIENLEKYRKEEVLSGKTLRKTSRLLVNKHEHKSDDIYQLYVIQENEVLTGVQCPQCLSLPMDYKRGKWFCQRCNLYSKDAHVFALKDYCLLIKPTITNSEFRHFLHLPSCNISNKVLSSTKLPCIGSTKGRVYHLDSLF